LDAMQMSERGVQVSEVRSVNYDSDV
jgi:hypothetical protein